LIEDHRGDTYRVVYTVRFATKIYVLHAFQKKSKRGVATPKRDLELIRERLKWAERFAHRQSQGGLRSMKTHENSSGNVFADLGLPNSEQELLKAKLTVQIYKLIKEQHLTQTKAAELLGTTQAQVSALMRCRPVSVSVGRLMEFLTILGQDVEVTVKPSPTRAGGHMSVVVEPG
jgi:predicted XRE-type DNA-binding protein